MGSSVAGGGGGGGARNSYTLWSPNITQTADSSAGNSSLDHKRKFNRSLCGVLLGISIVLVIVGILGIIGIAVYLGGKHWTSKTT